MSVSLAAHHQDIQELNIRTDITWKPKFPINKSPVEYSAEPSWQTERGKISTWLIKIVLVRSDASGFTVCSLLLVELLHRKCPRLCVNWVKMQRNETLREKQVINQVSRLNYLEVNTATERLMENKNRSLFKESLALVEPFTWEILLSLHIVHGDHTTQTADGAFSCIVPGSFSEFFWASGLHADKIK